jgi:hypothetical protein
MKKLPQWKVGICAINHYMLEVEAIDSMEAEEIAMIELKKSVYNKTHELNLTGCSRHISGVFLNDKETRGYVPYVPDYISYNELSDIENLE